MTEKNEAVVQALSRLLADSYTLYLKTHNYHWNVVGPMFNTLHLMFETQYNELALAVDLIAERIRALGMPAPGSYREFAELTSVTEDTDAVAVVVSEETGAMSVAFNGEIHRPLESKDLRNLLYKLLVTDVFAAEGTA